MRHWQYSSVAVLGCVLAMVPSGVAWAGSAEAPASTGSDAVVRAYTLKHLPAAEAAAVVQHELAGGAEAGVKVRADQFTNSIIVCGSEPVQHRVIRTIQRVDRQDGDAQEQGRFRGNRSTDTRVVVLQHAPAREVALQLRPLFETKEGRRKFSWFLESNAVIMRATGAELTQMEAIVRALDAHAAPAPEPAGNVQSEVVFLKHAEARALADLVGVTMKVREGPVPLFHVVHDERLNALVLRGRPEYLDQAKMLIGQLDIPVEAEGDRP